MFTDIKTILARSGDHLLEDLVGAAALVLMLMAGLCLVPGLL